ncbi:hypothetical protein LTR91_011301 [Friedmanniomyces endolithicus]|uniref:Aminotransferase class I/classII large domain-containing protein n=1 Tax=Friedmanniomyces endolithicus TaxID=329885 RepID=A0AAN6KHN9_9PEZI|nr:hypothetical protein LTR91_011301 [Friedmanniomyces endolithicus]
MEARRRTTSGLEATLSRTLDKRRSSSTIRQLTTTAPNAVDFSSNDFLSLATNPELRQSFLQELERGPPNTGSGGSRLLDGNSTYAETLERQIAAFHNAPAGLLCNSGFDANVGLFSCLPQPGDVIIHDAAIHASVHDGMRLSRAAQCLPFAHNDIASLRAVLQTCVASNPTILHGQRNIFVAVETVYSMDGDLAPLRAIVALLRDKTLLPASNAYLIVDEAHSTGLYGAQGRGLVCELGLENDVTVRLHTFGKALAANGAVLLCSPVVREYLVNYARPLIYTTFMSFPALAGVKASYAFLGEREGGGAEAEFDGGVGSRVACEVVGFAAGACGWGWGDSTYKSVVGVVVVVVLRGSTAARAPLASGSSNSPVRGLQICNSNGPTLLPTLPATQQTPDQRPPPTNLFNTSSVLWELLKGVLRSPWGHVEFPVPPPTGATYLTSPSTASQDLSELITKYRRSQYPHVRVETFICAVCAVPATV